MNWLSGLRHLVTAGSVAAPTSADASDCRVLDRWPATVLMMAVSGTAIRWRGQVPVQTKATGGFVVFAAYVQRQLDPVPAHG